MFRDVSPILRPRSIAMLGASPSGGMGFTRSIFTVLRESGYDGSVYLLNPKYEEIWGERCYPNFAALPEAVDLALVVLPPDLVAGALAEGCAHGLRGAVIYGAGFGEGEDPEGTARAAALSVLCRDGLRVNGPNCMGVLSFRERSFLYPIRRISQLPAGPVGVIFHSGGTIAHWTDYLATRGAGFSYAVTSGNELDVDAADYLNFMLDDEHTKLICCLLEGIRRPDAFVAAAQKALRLNKPLLVVKTGRSEQAQEAARSHTAALAVDDAVFDAVCERYGIIRCATLDDLSEVAIAFLGGRLPRGERVAWAGASGGSRGQFLDLADAAGLQLARLGDDTGARLRDLVGPGMAVENPLDVGGHRAANPDVLREIRTVIVNDPGVDLLLILGELPVSPEVLGMPEAFAAVGEATDKPVIASTRVRQNVTETGRAFLAAARIPFVQGLRESTVVVKALMRYAAALRNARHEPPPRPPISPFAPGTTWEDRLRAYGIRTPVSATAPDVRGVVDAAGAIGGPVALKLLSPQIVHKTEAGAVVVDLRSTGEVLGAAEAMLARAKHDGITDGRFLVQEMVSGIEMIVGVRRDPSFGPLIAAGFGGVFVDLLHDVAIRLLPVDRRDAAAMLGELRAAPMLHGYRGRPACDVEGLIDAIVAVGALFLGAGDALNDLEINPLMVLPFGRGVCAVDVRWS